VGLCGIPVVSRTVVVSSCPLINANEFVFHTCPLWVPIFPFQYSLKEIEKIFCLEVEGARSCYFRSSCLILLIMSSSWQSKRLSFAKSRPHNN